MRWSGDMRKQVDILSVARSPYANAELRRKLLDQGIVEEPGAADEVDEFAPVDCGPGVYFPDRGLCYPWRAFGSDEPEPVVPKERPLLGMVAPRSPAMDYRAQIDESDALIRAQLAQVKAGPLPCMVLGVLMLIVLLAVLAVVVSTLGPESPIRY